MTEQSRVERTALESAVPTVDEQPPIAPVLVTASDRYVKLDVFEAMTGYTPKAVYGMIDKGIWLEGYEFIKARGNTVLVDVEGYHRWVEHWRPTYASTKPRPPYI